MTVTREDTKFQELLDSEEKLYTLKAYKKRFKVDAKTVGAKISKFKTAQACFLFSLIRPTHVTGTNRAQCSLVRTHRHARTSMFNLLFNV